MKEAFEASHPGITVNAERIQSIDAIPRLDQEAATDADGADVVPGVGRSMVHRQLSMPATSRLRKALRWRGREGSDFYKDDYVIGAILPKVFAFNTTMAEPFTDFDGFLSEDMRGQYAICDTQGPPVIAENEWLREQFGDEYLSALLRTTEPVVYRSSSAIAEALAAGEVAAAQCMTPGAVQPLINEGAPIEMVIPEPEAFALPGGLAITGWSQRPTLLRSSWTG